MSFEEDGLCAETDPDLFFPIDEDNVKGGAYAHLSRALQVCARCPVQVQCLNEALDKDIRWGIWGGSTWTQRKGIKYGRLTVEDIAISLRDFTKKEVEAC